MVCNTCKSNKSADDFNRSNSHPSGLYPVCKECRKIKTKLYREKYGEKIRTKWRENHKLNPAKHRANARRYQKENWEYRKSYMRQWAKDNKEKAYKHWLKRNDSIKKATPKWLTKEQRDEMLWFYKTAKELQWLSEGRLSVDHIHPLHGENFRGLHVPWNLQIIPLKQNIEKSNNI